MTVVSVSYTLCGKHVQKERCTSIENILYRLYVTEANETRGIFQDREVGERRPLRSVRNRKKAEVKMYLTRMGIGWIVIGVFMMFPPTTPIMNYLGAFLFVGGGIIYLKGAHDADKDGG